MLGYANAARVNTYPEPNQSYAVTVLTDKGNIYEGVSYKSDIYTLTMQCEMIALANAAFHGEKSEPDTRAAVMTSLNYTFSSKGKLYDLPYRQLRGHSLQQRYGK